MAEDFIIDDPELIKEFINEFKDHIQNMDTNLLALEKNSKKPELIQEIFRAAHSIKGASAYLGLKKINEFTHKLENVLDGIRKGTTAVTGKVLDVLFNSVDILKQQIEEYITNGSDDGVDVSGIIEELDAAVSGKGGPASSKKKQKEKASKKDVVKSPGKSEDSAGISIEVFLETSAQHLDIIENSVKDIVKGSDDRDIYDKLYRAVCGIKAAASIMEYDDLRELMDQQSLIVDELRQGLSKATYSTRELIQRVSDIVHRYVAEKKKDAKSDVDITAILSESKSICQTMVIQEDKYSSDRKKQDVASGSKKSVKTEQTIRVSEGRLDSMMNLIGELIIVRNRFDILNKKADAGDKGSLMFEGLSDATGTMSRISNELQTLIMDVRMIPVSTVFNKFPRMVRDFSKARGKKIELQLSGEETAMDKTLVEKIGDPLVHLVRNAIDHGVESPEERVKNGKSETGTVRLSARNEGDNVIIEIDDDGKGIDPEFIKKKAVEKEIITEADAAGLSEKEALDLIFVAGFSTAEEVTDVSGRGVGMDVVKNNIKKLNGEIFIKTEKGKGANISIRLPMTLAIVKILMTGLGNALYAFPISSVVSTVKVSPEELSSMGVTGKAIIYQGRTLSVAYLSDMLGLENVKVKSADGNVGIIVISAAEKQIGLIVDRFYEQQEIVVKPLEGIVMNDSSCISGSAILGDGSIALVVDSLELVRQATSAGKSRKAEN